MKDLLLLPFCLGISLLRLFRFRRLISKADNIIVITSLGFGHSIHDPDIARRLFKGKLNIFIIFDWAYHNALSALLWDDIYVIFLPFKIRKNPRPAAYTLSISNPRREKIGRYLIRWLKKHTLAQVITVEQLYEQVIERYGPKQPQLRELISSNLARYRSQYSGSHSGFYFKIGWTNLINQVKAPAVFLPDTLRAKVRSRIIKFSGNKKMEVIPKLCCLYLRAKGKEQGGLTSLRRCGSVFENYISAVELLITQGFLVLLTGDRTPAKKYIEYFQRRLICASWLKLAPAVFSLFAETEADVWIGNAGGGMAPAIVNHIPILVLEAFPYGDSMPNTCLYFKPVRDKNSRIVPYQNLFSEHAFDYEIAGFKVEDTSADEIVSAVRDFLGSLDRPDLNNYSQAVLSSLPDYILAKHTNSRLSGAWLNLFR